MEKTLINVWQGGDVKNVKIENCNIDNFIYTDKGSQFNGIKYEWLVRSVTSMSLYDILDNKQIKQCSKLIKNYVDGAKKNNSQISGISLKEAEDFQKMIEKYAEAGCSLYSWY